MSLISQDELRENLEQLKKMQEKARDRLCSGENGEEVRKLYNQIDEVTVLYEQGKITLTESMDKTNKLYDEIGKLLGLE